MITYKLPKIVNVDVAFNLDTYAVGDIVLADGVLSVKDESGDVALKVRACDLLYFDYNAYAAGTANVVDVDVTGATLLGNTMYSMTIYAPNVVNFFQGGQETGATYQARTYVVSVDVTPTAAELQALFVARINADVNAYFVASAVAGDIIRITANNAGFGPLTVTHTIPGTVTVVDSTAWVAPVGTIEDASNYVKPTSLTAASYNRYIIGYNKYIRHNAVQGLQVVKPVNAVIFIDSADAPPVTLLTSILNGTYATVADYLGCPAV
jgi:hypothetical protein